MEQKFDPKAYMKFLKESGTFDLLMGLSERDRAVIFEVVEETRKNVRAAALREAAQAVASVGTGRPYVAKALKEVEKLMEKE